MPEVVGELKVDFNVIQSTVQTLWIGDNSDWVYAEDLPAYIYITLPGSRKQLEFLFDKNQICTYNSHNLGLYCQTDSCSEEVYNELPDGIYAITLKSGYEGFEKTRYYLKTDKIQLDMAKIIVANNLEYSVSDEGFRESIRDIDWHITEAKAFAIEGDFVNADRIFKIARTDLNKLAECKNCI